MVETETRLARTPDGRRVEVRGRVAAPPAAAWDLLVDTETWPDWGPSVRAVAASDRRIRTGTTGRVTLPGGLRVGFRITDCDGDRRRWTWRVARVPATGHRVDDAPGGCRVVFEVPPAAVGYVPVCKRALGRIAGLLTEP